MDAWLGDNALFPSHEEWHTEQILHLPRCFLAWEPAAPLPESTIDVVDSSSNGPISMDVLTILERSLIRRSLFGHNYFLAFLVHN